MEGKTSSNLFLLLCFAALLIKVNLMLLHLSGSQTGRLWLVGLLCLLSALSLPAQEHPERNGQVPQFNAINSTASGCAYRQSQFITACAIDPAVISFPDNVQ
jgi:hypothetical protein